MKKTVVSATCTPYPPRTEGQLVLGAIIVRWRNQGREKERFWVIKEPDGFRLKRLRKPGEAGRMTKEEVVQAIRASKLTFTRDWRELRQDTREP